MSLTSRDDVTLHTLDSVGGWIIDADGVLYRDTEVIPGAPEFIAHLKREGTPFVVLTNNSTKTPAQYVAKLAEMGIIVEEHEVLTSSLATVDHMRAESGPGTPVFVIGEDGIVEALRQGGFALVEDYRLARYVVVGLDRDLCFPRLQAAALAIRNGAGFIGTNSDRTLPTPEGLIPGNGSILAALEAATDQAPLVIGKPQPAIFAWAASHLAMKAGRVACLGDRLETDILGGHAAGLLTVLVLSGVTSPALLAAYEPKPDLVYPSAAELLAAWRSRRAS
ncbi:MAG: HAD-IIA family hydrolase [Anaerolineae bacterium]